MLQELIYNLSFADFTRFECLDLPYIAASCPAFWFNYLLAAQLLLLFVVIKVIAYYLNERKILKAYYERKARKAAVADDGEMAKIKWKGDKEFDEVDQDELSQQMRDELAKKSKSD